MSYYNSGYYRTLSINEIKYVYFKNDNKYYYILNL